MQSKALISLLDYLFIFPLSHLFFFFGNLLVVIFTCLKDFLFGLSRAYSKWRHLCMPILVSVCMHASERVERSHARTSALILFGLPLSKGNLISLYLVKSKYAENESYSPFRGVISSVQYERYQEEKTFHFFLLISEKVIKLPKWLISCLLLHIHSSVTSETRNRMFFVLLCLLLFRLMYKNC